MPVPSVAMAVVLVKHNARWFRVLEDCILSSYFSSDLLTNKATKELNQNSTIILLNTNRSACYRQRARYRDRAKTPY